MHRAVVLSTSSPRSSRGRFGEHYPIPMLNNGDDLHSHVVEDSGAYQGVQGGDAPLNCVADDRGPCPSKEGDGIQFLLASGQGPAANTLFQLLAVAPQ